jgi:hypothetical protein
MLQVYFTFYFQTTLKGNPFQEIKEIGVKNNKDSHYSAQTSDNSTVWAPYFFENKSL